MNIASVRIDRAERWIGYTAAALAATSFAILWVPNLHHASHGITGMSYLAVGLILASFIVLATASQRRVLLALAVLFTIVGPWGPEHLFQLLYLALAVWTAVRVWTAMRSHAAASVATTSPTLARRASRPVRPRASTTTAAVAHGRHQGRVTPKRARA